MWNFYVNQNPLCCKCGLVHFRSQICPAYKKQCFSCQRFGHYARKCFGKIRSFINKQIQSKEVAVIQNRVKSKKKQQRDMQRLDSFYDRKNLCRQLPFNNVRNSVISKFFNNAAGIKYELKCANKQISQFKSKVQTLQKELKNAKEENLQLREQIKKKECDQPNSTDLSNKIKYLTDEVAKFKEGKRQDDILINLASQSYRQACQENINKSEEIKQLKTDIQNHVVTTNKLKDELSKVSEQLEMLRSPSVEKPNPGYKHFKSNRGRFR